jgi:hypothetical protein
MLVIVGLHSFKYIFNAYDSNTKIYPDDVMGGALVLHPVQNPPSLYYFYAWFN